jgi:predicted dehydrogenase
VHELHHFLTAIREDADVTPHGATFEDGYRAAEVCDAAKGCP